MLIPADLRYWNDPAALDHISPPRVQAASLFEGFIVHNDTNRLLHVDGAIARALR